MPRRPIALLAIAAAVVIAAGCGAQTDTSDDLPAGDQQRVAQAIERLEALATEGDARTICDELLAGALKTQLSGRGVDCIKDLDDALADVDSQALEVQSVQVTGANATARVLSTDGGTERSQTFTLVREGTAWKLASLG